MNFSQAFIIFMTTSTLTAATPGFATEDSPLPLAQAKIMTATEYHPGTVRHLVTFRFRADTSATQIDEVRTEFLALKRKGLRNGRPYIVAIESGAANSYEGADQEKSIGFLVTFASEGDRNYYVGAPLIDPSHTPYFDPAHAQFKMLVGNLLATPIVPNGVFVFDYTVTDQAP